MSWFGDYVGRWFGRWFGDAETTRTRGRLTATIGGYLKAHAIETLTAAPGHGVSYRVGAQLTLRTGSRPRTRLAVSRTRSHKQTPTSRTGASLSAIVGGVLSSRPALGYGRSTTAGLLRSRQ